MRKRELYIEEFLRGELSAGEAARVAALIERDAEARAHAEWLERLNAMAGQARMTPPDDVVARLEARLLDLRERLEEGGMVAPARAMRVPRPARLPAWLAYPAPLLRAAALLLVGVLVGYGLWGTRLSGPEPFSAEGARLAAKATRGPSADLTTAGGATGMEEEPVLQELESRVAALERVLMQTYFTRVEAAMLHFVTGAAEGSVAPLSETDTRNLLSMTTNLKAERKSAGDVRMMRLLGQIETVLMEMDRLSRERDLTGARHVASVITEQGLLSTLQRLKAGAEE